VWRRRGAIIPFDDIVSILLQTPIGDEGVPSRRITIKTSDHEVPISTAYSPDHDEKTLGIADKLRGFLGASTGGAVLDSVRSLVENGSTLDAVRLLRQETGISLEEAHTRVEEMKRERPN